MDIVSEIGSVLDRIERGETSARLAPDACPGHEELAAQLNRLLDSVLEAEAWREVYPRELSLARERYEELLRVLSALRRLSDVLCTARTPEDVCTWAAEVLSEELEFEHCTVLLYLRESDELIEVASTERSAGGKRPRFSARLGSLGQAFRQRRPTLVFPAQEGGNGFLALAPLRAGEERLGLVKLARPLKGVPTRHIEHGLVLLSSIAAQMLKIVELKRRLDELNQGLGRELERQIRQSQRRSQEVEQLGSVLDELIDLSQGPVAVFSKTGRLVRVNKAAEDLLGLPASGLQGLRVNKLLAAECRRASLHALLGSLRQERHLKANLAVQTAAKRTVHVEVSLTRLGLSSEGGLWLAICAPRRRRHREVRRHREAAPAYPANGPKRLLIIDDEVQLLESLKELLSACNHEVTVAASALEGVRRAESEEFDLVLTDLGMPEMNGCQVAERIKACQPSTPVGVMTGWGSEEPPAELKAHGIDFVLRKPFDIQEVLDYLKGPAFP